MGKRQCRDGGRAENARRALGIAAAGIAILGLAVLPSPAAPPPFSAITQDDDVAPPVPPPGVTAPPALPPLRAPAFHPSALASLVRPPSALTRHGPPLPPARPLPATWRVRRARPAALPPDAAQLKDELDREVTGVGHPGRQLELSVAMRATTMLAAAQRQIDTAQIVLVVDRNPAVERLYVMLADPSGAAAWRALGDVRVSTGQAGRKDYYITPIGVFAHTDAILDFRALGTYNEHHVRGLGVAGMRVWDFGWQWALKGWHTDGAGGDIRLQMHATDPALLEYRLGHPASEGCVRISSSMNKFLDHYGVLDADYERAAQTDPRYAALLQPDRDPTSFAGRLLVVIDSSLPPDTPPTQASRPADWPAPEAPAAGGQAATPNAPGTDKTAAPVAPTVQPPSVP